MRNNTKCHQTIGPRLLKYLALFCMLKSVGAAPFPSSPAAELGAPSSACECSNLTDKLKGMAAEFNFGQFLQGENVPGSLLGVKDVMTNDDNALAFFLFHIFVDMAGIMGAKSLSGSLFMNQAQYAML